MNTVKYKAWTDEGMINVTRITFAGDIVYVVSDNDEHDGYEFQIDIKNLRQFTGLTDRLGVEIYEGDIVKEWPDSDAYWVRIVEYTSHGFALSTMANFLQHKVDWTKQVEVIGNIYENPHLLEQAS